MKPLLSSNFGVIDARRSVERALRQILSERREPYQHHLVFHRGRYFGVVQLSQLVRHAFELREDELTRAGSIQQHLVHRGDWSPPDYNVEILLDMAYELGGDFYHRQPLSEDRDLVACFDVSGKNVSAALSTSLISSFFATLEIGRGFADMEFSQVIDTLNRVLCRQTPPELFVAALLVFYDRVDQRLHVFNLGYSPLVVLNGTLQGGPAGFPSLGNRRIDAWRSDTAHDRTEEGAPSLFRVRRLSRCAQGTVTVKATEMSASLTWCKRAPPPATMVPRFLAALS